LDRASGAQRLNRADAVERLARVQSALSADDVLVEYLIGETRALAVVIERTSVHAVELARDAAIGDLERRAAYFAQRVEEATSADAVRVVGRAVAERVLDPVWAVTASRAPPRRLWVVADARLHVVPFAALVDREGRFLAERTAVSMLPSASVLVDRGLEAPAEASVPVANAAGRGVLAVAPELTWSRREARLAAAAAPSGTLLLDESATLAALTAAEPGRHRVFHFAGHATWDPTLPERSALWLAGTPATLSAAAIYAWRSAPPLVILSACESARQSTPSTPHGEGVYGLARAFLFAGSRQVVATLWPIADRPAFERMRDLYRALEEGDRVSDALGAAQRAAIAAGVAPRDWAAFVALGDPRWRALDESELSAQRRHGWLRRAAWSVAVLVGLAGLARLVQRANRHDARL
jgi:CHAT domain-containing protein